MESRQWGEETGRENALISTMMEKKNQRDCHVLHTGAQGPRDDA